MPPSQRDDLRAMLLVPRRPIETTSRGFRWFAAATDLTVCDFWLPPFLFGRLTAGTAHPTTNPECRTYETEADAINDFKKAVALYFLPLT